MGIRYHNVGELKNIIRRKSNQKKFLEDQLLCSSRNNDKNNGNSNGVGNDDNLNSNVNDGVVVNNIGNSNSN